MFRFLFNDSEEGQTLVEYGLLLALIAVIVIAALIFLGPVIADLFTDVGDQLNPAGGDGT
jgi:pilus assembly protein Flp/PilA